MIREGEGLLLYTDGVTEGLNKHGVCYGSDCLKSVVREHAARSAERICSEVLIDLEDFVGEEPQSDDIAMIVIKREPLSEEQSKQAIITSSTVEFV